MPVQLTREQYNQIYGQPAPTTTPTPSTLDTTPTPVTMTRAEYNAKYRPEELSFFQDAGQDLREAGQAITETIQEGAAEAGRITDRVEAGEVSLPKSLFQRFGKSLSTVGEAAFEGVLGVGKALIPEKDGLIVSEEGVRNFAEEFGNEFSQYNRRFIEDLQNSDDDGDRRVAAGIEEFTHLYNTDETFRTDVQAAGGVVEGLLSAVGLGPTSKLSTKVGQSSVALADEALKLGKDVADSTFKVSDEAIIKKRVSDIFDIENSYSKTRKVNDAFADEGAASRRRIAATDVLVDAVDDNGVIRTTNKGGAVDQYKAQTVDGVEDIVKRILIKENQKVNVNEIRDYLKTAIYNPKSVSGEPLPGLEGQDLITAINGIEREIAGLVQRADRFGNIPLSKIQDVKIAATKNINFLADSTPTITQRKAKAHAYKSLIEDKSNAPVKDINAELAKYYQDIERLRNLDGRRVQGGRLGKHFAGLSGQVVGGVVGSTGGPLGAGIGSIAGGELSVFLQGQALKGAFGRATRNVPEKNPILERAKRTADEAIDLKKADPIVETPKNVKADEFTREMDRQIKANVQQQKAAIKKGDFTLVAVLKDVYKSLVARLERYIDEIDDNIGAGLSIRSSVTPNAVAKKMDIEDVEEVRIFLDDPQSALLDDKLTRLIDEVGLSKADEVTQIRFLRETLDEVNQLVDSGKHRLITAGQKPRVRNLNQAQAPNAPNTAQSIDSTVEETRETVNA